jgi:hypothetical protein
MSAVFWKGLAAGVALLAVINLFSDWFSWWRTDRQKLKLPRPKKRMKSGVDLG